MPDSAKSMGSAAPVVLALLLLCWMAMLWTASSWIGKSPVPGRETDRMISQSYSGVLALLVWIFLAALLLIANSKQVVPPWFGAIAWVVLPISGVAALAAGAVLYNPERRWPIVIPAVVPVLIAAYVLYAFLSTPLANAGLALWAAVLLLSVSIVPEAIRFAETHLDDGSIDAAPGPKLDKWMADQRAARRARELAELGKTDDETRLYELESHIRPDSPVLKEALEVMSHLPLRQSDAVMLLETQSSYILHFLGDIDLEPTPQLCTAARNYLSQAVRERQTQTASSPSSYIAMEFTEGIESIRWISKNCGCNAQLDQMEAYARAQQQDSQEVQKFLAALASIRAEAKQ
jgi:hypothetical protein